MRNICRLAVLCTVCVITIALVPSCSLFKIFPKTVEVPATVVWFASEVDVEDGDELLITAEGLVSLNPDFPSFGPDGTDEYGLTPADHPLPDSLLGALVAKIGLSGDVFLVGSELTFTAPVDGELYFAVNDVPVTNNDGFYTVTIRFLSGPFG